MREDLLLEGHFCHPDYALHEENEKRRQKTLEVHENGRVRLLRLQLLRQRELGLFWKEEVLLEEEKERTRGMEVSLAEVVYEVDEGVSVRRRHLEQFHCDRIKRAEMGPFSLVDQLRANSLSTFLPGRSVWLPSTTMGICQLGARTFQTSRFSLAMCFSMNFLRASIRLKDSLSLTEYTRTKASATCGSR